MGKVGGCVLSLLATSVNICQDREDSHWKMKVLSDSVPQEYSVSLFICVCISFSPLYTEHKCHIWNKPTICQKHSPFSLFCEILFAFFSELNLQVSVLVELQAEYKGIHFQGIEKLALTTWHLLSIKVKVNRPWNFSIKELIKHLSTVCSPFPR